MPANSELVLGVSDFVALCNQTLEFAYPTAVIEGELANFRVSKNRWVYFDLKDEFATVRFFGATYNLPGPLEDGMMLRVRGMPRLHPLYGFSVTVQSIQPIGEGVIKRAAELLKTKLEHEGLFDEARKRPLPYPPARIGLITSGESAAYADFTKILRARWGGLEILLYDVQVQGEAAPAQIIEAIEWFNQSAEMPDVLVITRGGGSAEDLQAFSVEPVVRAVAASRIPTLAAIGHEIDLSLAELAADRRASTPSNAAELLTPDKFVALESVRASRRELRRITLEVLHEAREKLAETVKSLHALSEDNFADVQYHLRHRLELLEALNPAAILDRGFAIVRKDGVSVKHASELGKDDIVEIEFKEGRQSAKIS
jgi:exodeoxyribonuclease VII large subunit